MFYSLRVFYKIPLYHVFSLGSTYRFHHFAIFVLLNFAVGWILGSFANKVLPLSSILLEVHNMPVAATGTVVSDQCIINVFSGYSCVYVCFGFFLLKFNVTFFLFKKF